METFRQYSTQRKIITVIVIVGAISCCALAILLGSLTRQSQDAEPELRELITTYTREMAEQNYEAVYALFSSRVHGLMGIEEIEAFGDVELNFAIVNDVQGVQINSVRLRRQVNTDQSVPQGTVANVLGIVNYSDGTSGRLEGVFELENEMWRIHHINIVASPERVQNYLDEQ